MQDQMLKCEERRLGKYHTGEKTVVIAFRPTAENKKKYLAAMERMGIDNLGFFIEAALEKDTLRIR